MPIVSESGEAAPSASVDTRAAASTCDCRCERDRHLFCPGPKRILALDGGGVRGVISVAFLERIEAVLTERLGAPFHLGHWFDLIGGTSTGAVIAGALAMGYTIEDIKRFYLELAPKVFKRPFWRILGLQSKFDADKLRQEIDKIVGARTLDSEDLVTGFCLISKRMDTGSPWIIANNPRSDFWDTRSGEDGFTGNRHFPLGNLVRASTAAPYYFDPEWLQIVEGEKPSLFVDGAVTPHNNPAMVLFLMTVFKAHKIEWRPTPRDLTIVSVGNGSHRDRVVPEELGMGRTARLTYHALTSLMNDIQTFVVAQMQYLGECLTPWWINSEWQTLENEMPVAGKMFRFLRYDVRLELPWIEKELGPEVEAAFGRKLTDIDVIRMRSMDDPTIIPDIYLLASIAAKKQVKAEHWQGELAHWCDGLRPAAAARTMPAPEPKPPSWWFDLHQGAARMLSFLRSRLVRRDSSSPVPPAPPKPPK